MKKMIEFFLLKKIFIYSPIRILLHCHDTNIEHWDKQKWHVVINTKIALALKLRLLINIDQYISVGIFDVCWAPLSQKFAMMAWLALFIVFMYWVATFWKTHTKLWNERKLHSWCISIATYIACLLIFGIFFATLPGPSANIEWLGMTDCANQQQK